MDIKDFRQHIARHKAELNSYIQREFPKSAGAKVQSIIRKNFRLGGFQNGTLTKWAVTKRQLSGQGANSRRGPLLTREQTLYLGTRYKPGNARVTIYNDVPYAGIHNQGGTIRTRVTTKMRKNAWRMYYESGGGGRGKSKAKGKDTGDAGFWKGLALTKKQTLNIKIPKRQFMGPSTTIDTALQTMIKQDLTTILNK